MRAIERKARELRALLDELRNGEFMELDRHLRVLKLPEAERAEPLFAAGVTAQRTLCSLSIAAGRVADDVEGKGTLGRRETLGFSTSLVTFIAVALKDAGIAPNRTRAVDGSPSAFLEICLACFTDAGIGSDPDGAIQAFMTRHAEYKERGFCL